MMSSKAVFALAQALEGVPLLGVLEGSPAARAGARYGDVLLSVNGVRTRTIVDYLEAKNLRTDGMEIVVFRGDAEVHLAFQYDSPAPRTDPRELIEAMEGLGLLERDPSGSGRDS